MIKGDSIINSITYGNIVQQLAESRNIDLDTAKGILANMGFEEYHRFVTEAITPPSGNTIGPSGPTNNAIAPSANASAKPMSNNTSNPSPATPSWAGKGSPLQVGMTVGHKDAAGNTVSGSVSQVDMASNGVKIKNPVTGKDEWVNIDSLEQDMTTPTTESDDIARMRTLAGIQENCSAGATGAGAIAMAPAAMGTVKKRQEESAKKEYTPDGPAKTIVGDTKPSQASGELSANLAARGKKTASRTNNGFKR